MGLFEDNIEQYQYGEHFIPEHDGMNEEEKKRLEQLRLDYLVKVTGKSENEIVNFLNR